LLQTSCICELGAFGVIICDPTSEDQGTTVDVGYREALNVGGGYLLRVKPVLSDEGGVAAGFAVLSSPRLV
jgi:hypothetical protein